MTRIHPPDFQLLLLDETLWVLTSPTGIPAYDFAFSDFLPCRHQASLSIITGPTELLQALEEYGADPILKHQAIACREYVPLRPVGDPISGIIPTSFEFRTFWWRGKYVGSGPYWHGAAVYNWTKQEKQQGLSLAREAARRVGVAFLVVDIAQTAGGEWIVIECNDAQECGYGGVSPLALWQNIINIVRTAGDSC